MSLLSDKTMHDLWVTHGVSFDAIRAIEAAVLEAQGKQEPEAWEVSYKYGHIFLRISDEIFMLAYDPKSEPNTSEKEAADFFMAQLRRAISNIAAPVVQPDMVMVPREPTEKVIDALRENGAEGTREELASDYRVMIAAAEGKP